MAMVTIVHVPLRSNHSFHAVTAGRNSSLLSSCLHTMHATRLSDPDTPASSCHPASQSSV